MRQYLQNFVALREAPSISEGRCWDWSSLQIVTQYILLQHVGCKSFTIFCSHIQPPKIVFSPPLLRQAAEAKVGQFRYKYLAMALFSVAGYREKTISERGEPRVLRCVRWTS